MKKIVLVALVLGMTGCASLEMAGSGCVSATVKLNRTVTLYSATGDTIKVWRGSIYLEDGNGAGQTFMLDGKRVNISGTYIIEENR